MEKINLLQLLQDKLNALSKEELKKFVEASPKWGCKSPSMKDLFG